MLEACCDSTRGCGGFNTHGVIKDAACAAHARASPTTDLYLRGHGSSVNPVDFALPYNMHYIKFVVIPGQSYRYKVKGGSAAAAWSDEFEFRAPANTTTGLGAVTRLATYGDSGHSHYNNMGNLKDDAAAGLIDVVVHMGDHAYDLGNANDR